MSNSSWKDAAEMTFPVIENLFPVDKANSPYMQNYYMQNLEVNKIVQQWK